MAKKKKKRVKTIPYFSSFQELENFLKENTVPKKELEKALERIRQIEYQIQMMIYEGGPPQDND